ncbi:FabD/lysophospholipase-like protein, partial [Peniophora sp. CONT]
ILTMSTPDSIVSQPPLRILSLDGGGYRGLASLEILDRLMHELKRDDGTIPKPCEVFDFIIGTSTGGLIAILLGRLRYSVAEARDTYMKFGEKIFGDASR